MLNGRYINSVVNNMNEYKFRGKREDAKAWVYGYVFKTHKANPWSDETTWIFNEDGKFKVEPDTVGQYIGLKDKTGVEIYDSDIVEVDTTGMNYNPEIIKGIVMYIDGCFTVEFVKPVYDVVLKCNRARLYVKCFSGNKAIKVIGNIYEHEPHT